MKKLIIAAAIVCAAVVSQAASVDWSASNIYKYGSTSASATSDRKPVDSALIYLFCSQDYSQSAISTILGSTETTLAEKVSALDAAAINSGAHITGGAGKAGGTDSWSKAAGTYNYYMLIFDDTSVAENGMYVMSALSDNIAWDNSGDSAVAFGNQKSLTTNSANWAKVAAYSSSVPEPTSGLLMLIGVAGLALRRKRA